MNKKSIRFYKDHEVRAVWDEEKSTWWFSIVDIVGAITDSPNPRKYWSVLKTRLRKAGNELTTRCSQLKMTATDGKRYATDCFSQDDIIQLVRVIPSKKTEDFLDWFCQAVTDGFLGFLALLRPPLEGAAVKIKAINDAGAKVDVLIETGESGAFAYIGEGGTFAY